MSVFTAIIDTFNRPAMLKQAVDALRRQTHRDLEIILVDNAATPETIDYLLAVAREDSRVKLVRFSENQYSPSDPTRMLDTCLNAALREATGDYVWYQADDDLVADDYAEKMARLFEEEADCATAAGLPVPIDASGRRLNSRRTNRRPRYMPGFELALRHLRGDRDTFSAPGSIFTIRRQALLRAGGYHRALELSHLYGIVPFGTTGFDETALFYWRRHDGQLNKSLSASGWLAVDETRALMRDWDLERRWLEAFGDAHARELTRGVEHELERTCGKWLINNALSLRAAACGRILGKMWTRGGFWRHATSHLFELGRRKSTRAASRFSRLALAAAMIP
jgi:glycosyltransferase involved in cell wall biosynthesis